MPATHTTPRNSWPAAFDRLAPALAAGLAGVVVFHNALRYFFAQDDFLGLARAAGIVPRLAQPWRYLANQAVWDLLLPVGASHAWPYHLLSLIAHTACVLLLYRLLASRLAPWAALLGATFFAVHLSLFDALYWISTVGDPLALGLGLAAFAFQERSDRWRWLAVPLFAFSLVTKESLVLLPAVVIAWRTWLTPPARGPQSPTAPRSRPVDGVVIALAVVAVAYVVYFISFAYGAYFGSLQDAMRIGSGSQAPYALSVGAHLWQNLLTYLGWSVAFALPFVHEFSNRVEPGVYPWAIGALGVWLAGLAAPRLRRAGWLFGGIAWLLFLLPVLPLRNHVYHYYLYAPLAGAAWCVAAAAQWALGHRRVAAKAAAKREWPAWGVATLAAVTLTVNGMLLVRKLETAPFVLPVLRASSIVDRARIALNVRTGLAAARPPAGVTLLFWSPIASSLGPRGEPLGAQAPGETYWERNVRDALLDGLAVRVMFPEVAGVSFVREVGPVPPDRRYVVYYPDGRLGVATWPELDSILTREGMRP